MKKLIVVIERPDGSTFDQEVSFIRGNVRESIKEAKRQCGEDYLIVDYRVEEYFRNMTAKFQVVDSSKNPHLNHNDIFEVKRVESGASKYGDHSAHTITIPTRPNAMANYYDTRYDGISTDINEWLAFWRGFVEKEWGVIVNVVSYETEYVRAQ